MHIIILASWLIRDTPLYIPPSFSLMGMCRVHELQSALAQRDENFFMYEFLFLPYVEEI